jgi:hypothetical protein
MEADDLPVVRFDVRSAERVAAVRASRLLETGPEEAFNRLTRLGSAILGTPVVALTVVDDVRSFLKGAPDPGLICGPGGTYESPIDDAACHLVIDSGEVVRIPDTRADPRVRDLPQIRDFSAASWLGVPVLDPDGHVIGNLCAMDSTVRHWTDTEIETLGTLALAAGGEIALRLALRAADRHAAEASELADILEQSLIPTQAPELPGVHFGIHFTAGGTGVEVMGDFYDVFPVCNGAGFGVVIGDVCGQGALAARTTAMARSATRTAAHTEADPVQVLGIVNEVLHVWFAGHISFLTAAYATFEEILRPAGRPRAWRVSLASAGHPPGSFVGPTAPSSSSRAGGASSGSSPSRSSPTRPCGYGPATVSFSSPTASAKPIVPVMPTSSTTSVSPTPSRPLPPTPKVSPQPSRTLHPFRTDIRRRTTPASSSSRSSDR